MVDSYLVRMVSIKTSREIPSILRNQVKGTKEIVLETDHPDNVGMPSGAKGIVRSSSSTAFKVLRSEVRGSIPDQRRTTYSPLL